MKLGEAYFFNCAIFKIGSKLATIVFFMKCLKGQYIHIYVFLNIHYLNGYCFIVR